MRLKTGKLFHLTIHVVASTAVLSASIFLANAVESRASAQLLNSIRAILRNDQTVGNTALLARRLADLETLGTIECVILKSPTLGEIYNTTFKDHCAPTLNIVSPGSWREGDIQSVSGDRFSVRFKSFPNATYLIYLNLLRVAALILTNIGLLWYWSRAAAKDALELKVHEQLSQISKLEIDRAIQASLLEVAEQVSHDIRSPLSALNFALRSPESLTEDKRALVNNALSRINEITNDLLRKAKKTGSNTPAYPKKVGIDVALELYDLEALLKNISEEKKQALAERTDLKIHLDLKLREFQHIRADKKEFSRVISNLVNNAAEAIQIPGGVITIAARNNAHSVEIYVQDNGPGIPIEYLDKLGRERFSTKVDKLDSGNGLGLTHARAAVEAMSGELDIQPVRNGTGTRVLIRLPTC